jgi:hypothetical protein
MFPVKLEIIISPFFFLIFIILFSILFSTKKVLNISFKYSIGSSANSENLSPITSSLS